MAADFCDVGFNDSVQTLQTILIFVKIASDWGAKVFFVLPPDPRDCSLQLIKRDYGVMVNHNIE